MTRTIWAILYYILAITTLVFFQRQFQSDSGPGLNIYAFIVIVLLSLYLLVASFRTAVLGKNESYLPGFIHIAGLVIIIYLIFFDQVFMVKN